MATAKEISKYSDQDSNYKNARASAGRTKNAESAQNSFSIPTKNVKPSDLCC